MGISNVQLGTSATDIAVGGTGETRSVLMINFCNTDTTTRVISVYAFPSGGSATNATAILAELSIPAKDSYVWTANEKFILNQGDKIQGIADVASKVTATTSYYLL